MEAVIRKRFKYAAGWIFNIFYYPIYAHRRGQVFSNYVVRGCVMFVPFAPFNAVAQNTFDDLRKPTVLWQSPWTGEYFDSQSQAFDASKSSLASTADWDIVVGNDLGPCAGSNDYRWGVAYLWCASVVTYYKGTSTVYGSGTTSMVWAITRCPIDYEASDSYFPPTEGVDAEYFKTVCVKKRNYQNKHECSVGNPLFPNRRAKVQSETDYATRGNRLALVRNYNSDNGIFSLSYNIDFLAPIAESSSSCRAGYVDINGTKKLRCFEAINATPRGNTYAIMTSHDGFRDELGWNGSSGVSLLPMFKNSIESATIGNRVGWRLAKRDMNVFLTFDGFGSLVSVHYIDGQIVTLTRGERVLQFATDSFGRSMRFNYDENGSLKSVSDPSGRYIYFTYYNTAQPLSIPSSNTGVPATVIFQDGTFKTYLWDESAFAIGESLINQLTGILDENGKRYASFGYSNGNAASTEHAVGIDKFVLVDHRVNGNGNISISYPSGSEYSVTYGVINGSSDVISSTQPAGSGCNASTSALSYDANDNVISRDDFNGTRACMAYDTSMNVETVRVEGLVGGTSGTACGVVTAAAALVPAGSRKTSTTWHPLWRLATKVAEPGRITTSVYNGQPDPFNGGVATSCAPSTALLPDNSPIAVLCKRVEQSTTDVDGHLGFTPALQGGVPDRVSSWTYNQYGQVLTSVDALGNTTTSTYWGDTSFAGADPNAVGHTVGDLKTVQNAALKTTTYDKYDKNGQLLQSTDANGVVTVNTYDARQRLASTSVGGQLTGYAYWPTGLLKRVTQPDASYVAYGYDDAHRLTSITDNLGNTITYTLDNMGNRTGEATKDSGGVLRRSLTRSMDALSRVQQTTGVQ